MKSVVPVSQRVGGTMRFLAQAPSLLESTASIFRKISLGGIQREARLIRPYIDVRYYLHACKDLEGHEDAAAHYCAVGWRTGLNPCPWFCTSSYLRAHPDVAASNQNPFYHYVRFGREEGRKIWPAPIGNMASASENISRFEFADAVIVIEVARRVGNKFAYLSGWRSSVGNANVMTIAKGAADIFSVLEFEVDRPDLQGSAAHGFRLLIRANDRAVIDDAIALYFGGSEEDPQFVIESPLREAKPGDLSHFILDTLRNSTTLHQPSVRIATNWLHEVCALDLELHSEAVIAALAQIRWSDSNFRFLSIARYETTASYLNFALLAMHGGEADDVVLCRCCSSNEAFVEPSNEFGDFASGPNVHSINFDRQVPSTLLIREFLRLAEEASAHALIVLDDVSIAPVVDSIAQSIEDLRTGRDVGVCAWPLSGAYVHVGSRADLRDRNARREDGDSASAGSKATRRVAAILVPSHSDAAIETAFEDLPCFVGRGNALDVLCARLDAVQLGGKSAAIDLRHGEARSDEGLMNALMLHSSKR